MNDCIKYILTVVSDLHERVSELEEKELARDITAQVKQILESREEEPQPTPEVEPIHVGAPDDSPTKQSIIFNDCESVKKVFKLIERYNAGEIA